MTPDGSRSLAVEALAALAAGLLLGVVLVYLPLGLAAVSALDRVGQWQEVLGMSPPLRYRVFLALEEWMLPLAGIALAAIVVHVGVRRTLRRGVWFGDEPLWDAALSPAATSLLALALATVWFSADARRLPTLGGLAPLAAASGGLALFLSLVGLTVGAFRRFRPARQALALLIALLALLPLARVAADAWGGARLRALARSLQPEMEAERRRRAADRRPILRGPALEEDAVSERGTHAEELLPSAHPVQRRRRGQPQREVDEDHAEQEAGGESRQRLDGQRSGTVRSHALPFGGGRNRVILTQAPPRPLGG